MLDNWKLLAGAIIRRAFLDARRGDGDAAAWLADCGAAWLDAMGIDAEAVISTVVKKGKKC